MVIIGQPLFACESPRIREIAIFDLAKNVDAAASFCERTTLNDNRRNLMMIGVQNVARSVESTSWWSSKVVAGRHIGKQYKCGSWTYPVLCAASTQHSAGSFSWLSIHRSQPYLPYGSPAFDNIRPPKFHTQLNFSHRGHYTLLTGKIYITQLQRSPPELDGS